MSNPKDLKTEALVLRRTNFGEADRILNLLTPEGKISAIARGVRKSKSKLAGGIEMFSVSEITLHTGHSDLAILTSAKMKTHFARLLTDLALLELATSFLKQINRAADQVSSPRFFEILVQSLAGLNSGYSPELVQFWFNLNLASAIGEEPNLYRDTTGAKLAPDQSYAWDAYEKAFAPDKNGKIGKNEIKLARLALTSPLKFLTRIPEDDFSPAIFSICQL